MSGPGGRPHGRREGLEPSDLGPEDDDRFVVAPRQASEYLGISFFTLQDWVRKGYITYNRLPSGRLRFRMADLKKIAGQA